MARSRNSGWWLATLAIFVLFASGCGDENPTEPAGELTQQQAAELAQQLAMSMSDGGVAMTELDQMTDVALAAPSAARFATSSAASESLTVGEVHFHFTYTFFDLQGQELPGYDTTAVRMVATARAWGSISDPTFDATIGHAALLDIDGLQPQEPIVTINGNAADTLNAQFADTSGSATLAWLGSLVYTNVEMYKDSTVNEYPLSGTATWTVDADAYFQNNEGQTYEATYMAVAVITFNGTEFPDIVINGTYRFRANLRTGQVVAV